MSVKVDREDITNDMVGWRTFLSKGNKTGKICGLLSVLQKKKSAFWITTNCFTDKIYW